MKNDQENQRLKAENARLYQTLAALEAQLKLSNQANADLQKLLASLQEKLDILIVQYKKRNRREFGSKNERHNPRTVQTEIKAYASHFAAPSNFS